MTNPPHRQAPAALLLCTLLAGCGGGGPLDNPQNVANPPGLGGQKLSFIYFMRCVNPVLNTPQTIVIQGATVTNTCSSAGCHDNASGTGGALRLQGTAPAVDLAQDATLLRDSDMYKNFYSAMGASVVGSPLQSPLLNKPLVRDTLHGGGLILDSAEAPAARTLRYWINRPLPQGQDEFSSAAADSMFTPADAATGACNSD